MLVLARIFVSSLIATTAFAADGRAPVIVRGHPSEIDNADRYAHSLPEVDGALITVTKKTSVTRLDEQPPVIDNNQRSLFARLPGVFISEQQNPDQLNLGYRGIGNPQESEFVLLLQDGVPMMSDWIGFPTLYYLPVPESLESVQLIRGGSGLLYGPEPQPVVNFVSRRPESKHGLAASTQQVGGSDSLYSTYSVVSGAEGAWSYLGSYHHRQSDGRRLNGDYTLDSGDLQLGYAFDSRHRLNFSFHAYGLESGDAGRMSYAQWRADPDQTTTPYGHTWVNRYTGVLTYEGEAGDRGLLVAKLWSGYQDLDQRTTANIVPPALPWSSALSIERFTYTGADVRYRKRWGRGNAFTVGLTAYQSEAPWLRYGYASPGNLQVQRHDRSGTVNLDQDRRTQYGALFAENVFRFGRFHLVPSVRYEHESLDVNEHVVPGTRPLIDRVYRKQLPLFGIGFGNDFGHGNETYVNVSQGFRPLRYLDVASPFGNTNPALNDPDPTRSLSYEAGVHGWPGRGLFYDVSVFQVDVKDRIESQPVPATPDPTDTINVNTGNTRSRGVEAQLHQDLLRLLDGVAPTEHLELYASVSLLDAEFTQSSRGLAGSTPAFAPRYLARAGAIWRRDNAFKLGVNVQTVGASYWQDSNQAFGAPGALTYMPAQLPSHTLVDVSGEISPMPHLTLLAGISNLFDRQYYSRVFQNTLEPGTRRTAFVGFSLGL